MSRELGNSGDTGRRSGGGESSHRYDALRAELRGYEAQRATLASGIRDNLHSDYANTVSQQEQIIRRLVTGITRANSQLAGRVAEILTRHGTAYQNGVNLLDSQVLRGTMDQATRNEREIALRADLYADRMTDLEKFLDDFPQ